jgi:hypothetical protein
VIEWIRSYRRLCSSAPTHVYLNGGHEHPIASWDAAKDVKQAMTLSSTRKRLPFCAGKLHWLGLCILLCSFPCRAQQAPTVPATKSASPELGPTEASTPRPQNDQLRTGTITGNVIDQSGAFVPGAVVKLTREGQPSGTEVFSDHEGQFSFSNVAPGSFQLTITSAGLAPQEFSFTLEPGEAYVTPLIMLNVATQVTEVRVALTPVELATAEIKDQEKQRVFGVIPNFYVSYVPEAAPLTAKHKFELAWKSTSDPITFVGVGAIAGVDQAGHRWGAYGQGVQGYSKRFAATYADVFAGTFIGSAILPSLLKQDPRYFYKGKGTKRSRLFYALANSVICKGDDRRWQPNYSTIVGNLAAGGLSNLYYPANDRHGLGTVVTTAMTRLAEMAVANVFQEFLVPKLTPNLPTRAPSQP